MNKVVFAIFKKMVKLMFWNIVLFVIPASVILSFFSDSLHSIIITTIVMVLIMLSALPLFLFLFGYLIYVSHNLYLYLGDALKRVWKIYRI